MLSAFDMRMSSDDVEGENDENDEKEREMRVEGEIRTR